MVFLGVNLDELVELGGGVEVSTIDLGVVEGHLGVLLTVEFSDHDAPVVGDLLLVVGDGDRELGLEGVHHAVVAVAVELVLVSDPLNLDQSVTGAGTRS